MQISNHTQIANEFILNMKNHTGGEVKVFLAICKKTIGWHKLTDRISYSQLKEITGMSVNALKASILKLRDKEIIHQEKVKNGYVYDINYNVLKATISKIDTLISKTDTPTISKTDTTIDIIKDTKTKDIKKKQQTVCSFKERGGIPARWCKYMETFYCPDQNLKQCTKWLDEFKIWISNYIVYDKKYCTRDGLGDFSKTPLFFKVFTNKLKNWVESESKGAPAKIREYYNKMKEDIKND